MGYEGKFWFGNPPQEMQVVFDTGSAYAWLFSEKCGDKNCPKNAKFHQTKSSDYTENDQANQLLGYGEGQV